MLQPSGGSASQIKHLRITWLHDGAEKAVAGATTPAALHIQQRAYKDGHYNMAIFIQFKSRAGCALFLHFAPAHEKQAVILGKFWPYPPKSKRAAFITFTQAETKSFANSSPAALKRQPLQRIGISALRCNALAESVALLLRDTRTEAGTCPSGRVELYCPSAPQQLSSIFVRH